MKFQIWEIIWRNIETWKSSWNLSKFLEKLSFAVYSLLLSAAIEKLLDSTKQLEPGPLTAFMRTEDGYISLVNKKVSRISRWVYWKKQRRISVKSSKCLLLMISRAQRIKRMSSWNGINKKKFLLFSRYFMILDEFE